MASKTQRKVMVFDDGGAGSPAAAPSADFDPRRFGQTGQGVRGSSGNCKDTSMTSQTDVQSGTSVGTLAATKPPRGDLLTAKSTHKGIQVTLDNNNMWNEFFSCKTEMILTKQGSRMFPYCRFRISGLQPSRKYVLMMDIQLVDQNRYMWTGTCWQVAGKAERHMTCLPFVHTDSPSTGQHWMQNPVSFYKLKLTSNTADQEGNAVLHPMHRYMPRLHVVQTEKAAKDIKLNASNVATFTFQQTEFMAVTAYHNSQFAQLKVEYNPFSKGLREDGVGSLGLKVKSNHSEAAATAQQQPLKRSLKSLLANHKARSSTTLKSATFPETDCVQDPSSGSVPKVVKSSTCKSRLAEKFNGDLIREAHISLTRCNVDSLTVSSTFKETNSKFNAATASSQDAQKADKTSKKSLCESPSQEKSGNAQGMVVCETKSQSEGQLKTNVKRPLPLPALALFLKKHSTKTKAIKSELKSASTPVLGEVQTGTASSNQHRNLCSDLKHDNSIPGESGKSTENDFGKVSSLNIFSLPFQDTAAFPESKESETNDHGLVNSAPESKKGRVEERLANHKTFISSTQTTSSPSVVLSPLLDTNLDIPHMPPALSSETKSGDFLPDTPCSPFGFTPLSPSSSPEPLPSLPATFSLELDSTSSGPPENLQLSKDSSPSVFKWHTVLPPPEPYVDPSFEVFHPKSQSVPLGSSLSPSRTPANDPSQSPAPNRLDPPSVDSLPFQESEQPLPFPGELSPLALPLTLSPTFSSLDGDALSPTPSIADLVQFFSAEENLGIGVEFPSADLPAPPCSLEVSEEAHASAHLAHAPAVLSPKSLKGKKKLRRRKNAMCNLEPKTDDTAYTTMKPNLEEVEEQLFISFTSKEALKLHIADSEQREANSQHVAPSADVPPQQPTEQHDHEATISAFEDVLRKDVKMMKHHQVIHPVLQEVGLKMNLLDASLSIDLQYLGVRLPIPPPGTTIDAGSQELPTLQSTSGSFVSRTGKTTDVTQIKGWREKFSPSEPSETPSPCKPEASASSEQPKKNLSAFCSDMLDQYLESEAKLIDQRVASFSQPPGDSLPVYEHPASSTSYVRTLNSVLKKQSPAPATSELISGFIPPSKRAKAPLRQLKVSKKVVRKPKRFKPSVNPSTSDSYPSVGTLRDSPQNSALLAEPLKPNNPPPTVQPMTNTQLSSPMQSPPVERKKRFKHIPTHLQSNPDGANLSAFLKPMLTRGLLRQKDLEDSTMWGGQPRTFITEERASIALTSLFTLKGFVSDNPTAPIQLPHRPEHACFNDFCRLGCVCNSLAHTARFSHCGRPQCMLGCSCLKQKVVLLKNLDGSDSSPSSHGGSKRKKKKRMKMAYILKEADSVSQPAERVRTLWKTDNQELELDPIHIPKTSSVNPCTTSTTILSKNDDGSCARVRRFVGKSTTKEKSRHRSSSDSSSMFLQKPHRKPKRCKMKYRNKLKALHPERKPPQPMASTQSLPAPSSQPQPVPPSEPQPPPSSETQDFPDESKASKRLTILTECRWRCDEDREHVLKILCEAMAQNQLDKTFWTRQYQINPISQTVEDCGTIHYKVLVSKHVKAQQDKRTWPVHEPVEAWQREVTEQDFADDWSYEVGKSDTEEESEASTGQRLSGNALTANGEHTAQTGLPFFNGVSTAGHLSANTQPADGGYPIKVNGKMYPVAKIQLGEMGALHPANRLAAYLTGRVAATKKQVPPTIPEPQRTSSPFSVVTCATATSKSVFTSTSTSVSASASYSNTTSTSVFTSTSTSTSMSASTSKSSTTSTSNTTCKSSTTFTTTSTSSCTNTSASKSTATAIPTSVTTSKSSGTTSSTSKSTPILVSTSKSSGTTTSISESTATSVSPSKSSSTTTSTLESTTTSVSTFTSASPLTYIFVPPPPTGSVRIQPRHPRIPIPTPPHPSIPTSPGVRMILRPVQSPSSVRYYRRPDGKLFQLIPINQLRPIDPAKTSPTTSASGIVGPIPIPPLAASDLSGFKSFTTDRSPAPLCPDNTSLSQKFTSFRITPATSTKNYVPTKLTTAVTEPAKLTTPVPEPVPSKAVAPVTFEIEAPVPAPDLIISEVRSIQPEIGPAILPDNPKNATAQIPGETPVGPKVTPLLSPLSPEPAMGLADLDVCVVDDVDILQSKGVVQEINLIDSTDDTDNSSDFEKDNSDQNKGCPVDRKQVRSASAKIDRHRLAQLTKELKAELQLGPFISIAATLHEAIQVIEKLKTKEKRMKRKKLALTRQRDRLMATLAPPPECDSHHNTSQTGSSDRLGDDVPKVTNHTNTSNSAPIIISDTSSSPSPYRVRTTSTVTPATAAPSRRRTHHQSLGSSSGDDIIFVASTHTLPKEQAPPHPSPVTPPPALPKSTPAAFHGSPMARHRTKTVPNILSRSKSQGHVFDGSGNLSSFQTVLPTELLSVVGATLPGQPFLTLTPLMTQHTPLPFSSTENVTAVTLNLPTFPNQQQQPDSTPHPPTDHNQLCSFPTTPQPAELPIAAPPLESPLSPKDEGSGLNGHALAPPPLLHMKAGGVQTEHTPPAETPAPDGVAPQCEEASWRPMPKLVPLGLRGAPPT
ncbi:MAX dimerization protein MGA a isoform X2 [Corythoichthys intestinalis]|uniref:MAX dimerization protein MGA a isoform X2 n=1 Tax=Corythoichthys intestinalis TaxID=161448 RepID=UPI0025A6856B|nr:MAX dimerization protein MGA a isoform X2 [Corythoichthys intestinalis]